MIRYHAKNQTYNKYIVRLLFFIICLFGLLFPVLIFAKINITELLPNPGGDDTLGEYIELRNIGCSAIDIGGHYLVDASFKKYMFPERTILISHENLRLTYAKSKIALNNSGIESITLFESGGSVVDSYSYSGTQHDNIVLQVITTDDVCIVPSVGYETGSTSNFPTNNAHSVDTGSLQGVIPSTASVNTGVLITLPQMDENGYFNTGVTQTGNHIIPIEYTPPDVITDIENAPSSHAQTENLDPILSNQVQFPNIIPTLQFPTNAIFSGTTFDCTGFTPCRINITLVPIFTGGILEKNFRCELVFDNRSVVDCNPATMYFSGSSTFKIQLTSLIDSSQSRSIVWEVVDGLRDTPIDPKKGTINLIETGSISREDITGSTGNVTSSGLHLPISSFPDISVTFQNYTNTNNSGEIITCINAPCRVNFTLDPIFTGSFIERDYQCEVRYGTGIFHTCNPPQLYLYGTGDIDIALIHELSSNTLHKILHVIQDIPLPLVSGSINYTESADVTPPILILEFDGKLKSYHDIIGDTDMNCYSYTCAINLTADKSYDAGGGDVRYLWYYGPNDIKITKDPGERKYGLGDHEIWLRIIDTSGNVAGVRYHIHVLGPREVSSQIITEKQISHTEISKNKGNILQKKKAKKKPKKFTFFDPPTIFLQNSKFREKNNRYLCHTETKSCSLNLSLMTAQPGIIYTWIYDNGVPIITKNPKSRILSPGMHTIQIIAGYSSGMPLWRSTISAEVVRIKKMKKLKKPKIIQKKVSKHVPKVTTPYLETKSNTPNSNANVLYVILALIGGIVLIRVLKKSVYFLSSKLYEK